MGLWEKKRLIEAYDLKVTLSNFFSPIFIGMYLTYLQCCVGFRYAAK